MPFNENLETFLFGEDELWEIFHQNTKTTRYEFFPTSNQVMQVMARMPPTHANIGLPVIKLPPPNLPSIGGPSLSEVFFERATPNDFDAVNLSLKDISTLLYSAAGENRPAEATGSGRAFRVVPSGGALYPLELYINIRNADDCPNGLYHYDPTSHVIRLCVEGDQGPALSKICVQPNLPLDTSLHFLYTAIPSRLTFKYGDKGYRFALLEAGHSSQNVCLISRALGYEAIPVGGFLEEELESLLQIDGVNQVALYLTFVGARTNDTVQDPSD